jgi:hypothetical protein
MQYGMRVIEKMTIRLGLKFILRMSHPHNKCPILPASPPRKNPQLPQRRNVSPQGVPSTDDTGEASVDGPVYGAGLRVLCRIVPQQVVLLRTSLSQTILPERKFAVCIQADRDAKGIW